MGDVLPGFIPTVHSDNQARREDSIRRLLDMAFWHNDTGNIGSAIQACKAVLGLDAENVSALSLLSSLYEKQGRIDDAIEAQQRVVQFNPGSVADAEKLERLLSGFHEASIKAPDAYRWIPPVLGRYMLTRPSAPAIAATLAGLVILVVGLGALHAILGGTGSRGSLSVLEPKPGGVPSQSAASVVPAPAGQPQSNAVVMTPSPAAAPAVMPITQPNAPTLSNPNVMGPAGAAGIKIVRAKGRRPMAGQSAIAPLSPGDAAFRSASVSRIPSVKAVKPIDMSPQDSVAALGLQAPQHTVVVAAPSPGQFTGQGGGTMVNDPPPPPSHIEMHVHGPAHVSIRDSTSVPQSPAQRGIGGMRGADLQSHAMRLLEQGSYNQAASTYQGAIEAYQADISAGRNVDFAKRGIASCQTGIKICNQSQ